MLQYEVIAEFRSKTKPGKCYIVKKRLDTGMLTCNCPAWIFNKYEDRTCYHTLKLMASGALQSQQQNQVIDRIEAVNSGRRVLILDE